MRVPPLLFWLTAALGAVSLGVSAGPVVWRLAGDSGTLRPLAASPGAAAEVAAGTDLAPILAFAPFGSASVAAPVPQVAGETALGLRLLGVTIAEPASASRAIIAGGDARVRSYAVGAEVTAEATLDAVNPDHVVLRVGDRLETLSFARPGSGGAAPRSGGVDLNNLIPQAGQGAAKAPAAQDADAVIARYRAAIQLNPKNVLDRLGVEVTDQGYRISDAASAGVRQAGFRPGDVITTVNGQKVGDIATDQRYFDDVAAAGRARVELMREGQTIVMTFPLR